MKGKGRKYFLLLNQKGFVFLSPNQKVVFWEVKINSFWEGKKMILGCLKKKSDGYSLEEQ